MTRTRKRAIDPDWCQLRIYPLGDALWIGRVMRGGKQVGVIPPRMSQVEILAAAESYGIEVDIIIEHGPKERPKKGDDFCIDRILLAWKDDTNTVELSDDEDAVFHAVLFEYTTALSAADLLVSSTSREAENKMDTHTLHVYRAESGQWSGVVYSEVARIAGCSYPVEVLETAREQFPGIVDLPRDSTDDEGGALRVNLAIPQELVELAQSVGTSAQDVIENFIRDLCELPGNNGSDERMHVDAWFNRVLWPILMADDENDDDKHTRRMIGPRLTLAAVFPDGNHWSAQMFAGIDPSGALAGWRTREACEAALATMLRDMGQNPPVLAFDSRAAAEAAAAQQ